MQTLVISYFCDVDGSTYYSDHAARFREECERLQIPAEITQIQSLGSYQDNCLVKPKFIYSKLTEHKRPILWLDIDTFILKQPNVFDGFANLGVSLGAASTEPNNLVKIKASPLWFNFNNESLEFVKTWINQCEFIKTSKGNLFDHETFIGCAHKYLIEQKKKVAILGEEYCAWPGKATASTVLMMGLSDAPSKKEALKKMGYNDELVEWQSPGNSFMEIKI